MKNKKANKTKSTGRYGCIFQVFYEEIKPIVYHKEKEWQVKTIGIWKFLGLLYVWKRWRI